MGTRATPMDIASPAQGGSRFTASSNALHPTTGNESRVSGAIDINGGSSKGAMSSVYGRRDSVARTGAQPISTNTTGRERPRKDSLAGSMITGMSWGGTSVGSWIRDDIIMQGTSPFPQYQSPSSRSFHSSSYVPKLEADFMTDFHCCGLTHPTMHELLTHCENNHAGEQGQPLSKQNSRHGHGTPPDPKAAIAAGAAAAIVDPSRAQQQQNRVKQQSGNNTPQRSATPVKQKFTPPYSSTTQAQPTSSTIQDDDTVGTMEMDDFLTSADDSQAAYRMQNATELMQGYGFGQQGSNRVPPLELNTQFQQYRGLRESTPTTPVSATRGAFYRNDPTVSSVNTPTMPTHPSQHPLHAQQFAGYQATPDSSAPGTPGELADDFIGNTNAMSAMNLGNNSNMYQGMNQFGNFGFPQNEMFDLQCIDEPAKRLFSVNGAFTTPAMQQQQMQQGNIQNPQSLEMSDSAVQLGDGQYGENSEIAKTIREEQAKAGVPDPSADGIPKPFHCPVIGCEKAYKNQNGLKYHKAHGHNAQVLRSNANGTFSIVDPETHKAYEGSKGMEKHKPYKCDICGKRYKNLNGLKYHKGHSKPCQDRDEAVTGLPPT